MEWISFKWNNGPNQGGRWFTNTWMSDNDIYWISQYNGQNLDYETVPNFDLAWWDPSRGGSYLTLASGRDSMQKCKDEAENHLRLFQEQFGINPKRIP